MELLSLRCPACRTPTAGEIGAPCPKGCERHLVSAAALNQAPSSRWLGRRLSSKPITLVDLLGRGGMGAVYLGLEDISSTRRRKVAVKFMLKEHIRPVDWPSYERRFRREAGVMLDLKHPSALTLHGFGEEDGDLFMVLEYVDGETLAALIKREGRLSFKRATELLLPVLKVLNEAHRLGLIHRDLKPANLMIQTIGRDLQTRVLDFGISKFLHGERDGSETQEGTIIGSPAYMAPEHTYGKPEARSDLYAVGIMLYEIVVGERPFEGRDQTDTIRLQRSAEAPRLSPELSFIQPLLDRALAKRLPERFPNAEAFEEAINRVLMGEPLQTPTLTYSLNAEDLEEIEEIDAPSAPLKMPQGRDGLWVWGVLGLLACALGGWLGYTWLAAPSAPLAKEPPMAAALMISPARPIDAALPMNVAPKADAALPMNVSPKADAAALPMNVSPLIKSKPKVKPKPKPKIKPKPKPKVKPKPEPKVKPKPKIDPSSLLVD